MKKIFIFLLLFLYNYAKAESFIKSTFVIYENDSIYGGDEYYSNGIQLFFLTKNKKIKQKNYNYSFGLGQKIYTPNDIEERKPLLNDRPYTGYLYLFLNKNVEYNDRIDTFGINIGTTGKNSLAENTQKFVHSLIKSPEPMGWKYQLKNDLLFSVGYMKNINLFTNYYNNYKFSIISKYTTNIGTPITNFSSSIEFRYGLNTNNSYIPNKIQSLVGNIKNHNNFYLFFEVAPNFVFYDYFLEKNVDNLKFNIKSKFFRYDIVCGLDVKYNNFYLKWSNILTSKEFTEQDNMQFLFSLNFSYIFN